MRFLKTLFIICITHCTSYAQSNSDDAKAVAMLKAFYMAHSDIEAGIKTLPPGVYVRRSDSLQKISCTAAVLKYAKKYSENGVDLFTQDHNLNAGSFKTMTIVQAPARKNIYTISYDVSGVDPSNKPINRHVTLQVGVIKVGENYKIASIN
jgi:hypothetical protein